MVERICQYCNKIFTLTKKSRIEDITRGKFCSKSCVSSYRNKFITNQKFAAEQRTKYPTELIKENPHHWLSFCCMHNRKRDFNKEVDKDFERNPQGFVNFVNYLGPVPDGMRRPSIGRKDHSIGYIKGNFEWQEFNENAQEATVRYWKVRNENRVL